MRREHSCIVATGIALLIGLSVSGVERFPYPPTSLPTECSELEELSRYHTRAQLLVEIADGTVFGIAMDEALRIRQYRTGGEFAIEALSSVLRSAGIEPFTDPSLGFGVGSIYLEAVGKIVRFLQNGPLLVDAGQTATALLDIAAIRDLLGHPSIYGDLEVRGVLYARHEPGGRDSLGVQGLPDQYFLAHRWLFVPVGFYSAASMETRDDLDRLLRDFEEESVFVDTLRNCLVWVIEELDAIYWAHTVALRDTTEELRRKFGSEVAEDALSTLVEYANQGLSVLLSYVLELKTPGGTWIDPAEYESEMMSLAMTPGSGAILGKLYRFSPGVQFGSEFKFGSLGWFLPRGTLEYWKEAHEAWLEIRDECQSQEDTATGSSGPIVESLLKPYDIRASDWDESRSSEKVIRVRWECDSVGPVTYEIYRAGTRTSVPQFIGSTTETTYWDYDPGIIPCEAYYYYVRACDSTGCSSEATRSGMGTPAKGSYDCRPSSVDSLSVSRITATALPLLSWAPSLYANKYEVLRADSSDGQYESLGVQEPGFVDESLLGLPAADVWYKIRTSNLCGSMLSQAERFEYTPPLGSPSDLSAQSMCGEVLLRWNAVPGATEYRVYRSAAGEPWTADALATTGDSSFSDQDVSSLGVFSYMIEACANGECGDASAPVRVEHASRPTSAAAYFEVTNREGQVVGLHWGDSPLSAYYEVWRTSDSAVDRVLVYEGSDRVCSDGDADIWTTYHYELIGVNSCGSGPALELAVNPSGGMITSVSASSECGEIVLEWESVPGATEYRVFRSGPGEESPGQVIASIQSTSFIDSPLESNGNYCYRIQATKKGVFGPMSEQVQVWYPGNPPAPTVFYDRGRYGTRLHLSWDPIPHSSGYEVWRTNLSTGDRTRVYEGDQPRCTDTEADKCANYLYELRGVNDCGFGRFGELESAALSWIPVTEDCVDVSLDVVEDVGVVLTLHYKGGETCPHPDDGLLVFSVYRDGNYKWGSMPLGYDDDGYGSPPLRDANGNLQWVDESPGDLCESHFYQVEVWTHCGSGGLSEPLYTELQERPSAPEDFEIVTLDDGFVRIQWSECAGASEYRVFATFTGVPYALYSETVADPICTVKVPEHCGTLYFGVWAGNALCRFGEYGGFRTVLGAAPETPDPLILGEGLSEGVVRVAWPPQDAADWYEIFRESDDGSMATFSRSVELFTEIVPEMCTQYKYSVRACNDCGCSEPTDPVSYRAVNQPASILDAQAEIDSNGVWMLTWSESPGATYYEVEKSLDGTEWQRSSLVTETQLLINPDEYCGTLLVRLRAGNDCFQSEWSEILSVAGGQEPGRPSWVMASSSTYEDKIRVSWSPVDSGEWYEILREDANGTQESFTSTIASYWDRRLEACSEYTYSVRACNDCGCSSHSTPYSGSTAGIALATAPADVTATQYDGPNSPTGGYPDRIVVEWESLSDATRYEVYRSTAEISGFRKIGETDLTSYTDRSAATCTDYFYRVAACSDCGCGGQSQSALGSRGCDVPAPTVAASDGSECGEIQISWTSVTDVDGYDVMRGDGPSLDTDSWTNVGNNLTQTSMIDDEIEPGQTYWYAVNAFRDRWGSDMYHDLVVDSGYAGSLPQAPSLLGLSGDCDRMTVYFSPVDGAEYYELFVNYSNEAISSGGGPPLYHNIEGDCPQGNSYQVRACNDCGCGERSDAMPYFWEPGGPRGLTISDGGCALCFNLSWNVYSCTDSYYTIYRSESPSGPYNPIGTTTSTDYSDSFNDDIDYWYKVSATTACGESELSASVGTCEVVGDCP